MGMLRQMLERQIPERAAQAMQQTKAAQAASAEEERKQKREPYPMSNEEQYVMGFMDEAKRVRLSTLESFEPIWTRNILYTAAIQHLRWATTKRQFEPRSVEEWIPLPVLNIIQPKVQRVVDFFTRKKPEAQVVPNSTHQDDIDAASLGDKVRSHLWDYNHEFELYEEAATWNVVCGNVFRRHYIAQGPQETEPTLLQLQDQQPLLDMTTGQPVIDPTNGMPVMIPRYQEARDPMTGMVQPDPNEATRRMVRCEVGGPMQYTVPLAAPRFSDSPWWLSVTMHSLSALRNLYPDKEQYIGDRGRMVTSDLYQHRILSLLTSGLHGVVRSLDPYTLEGFGLVYHYERAPTPEHPNGIMLIALDDVPLEIDELPLGNQFSAEHCGYYRVPGRFWHRGMVEDLVEVQDQLNKLEQFLQLNDAYNINPRWFIPTQSGIPEGTNTNRPGINIRYNFPYKPEVQEGISMPAQVVQRQAIYMEMGEELSGVRNVLMGGAPGGVTAGVALNRLGEEAEGMFSPISQRWDRFIERCEQAKLKLVQKYFTEPQLITIQGDDGNMTEIRDFVGQQLRGNTRVKLVAASYRPRSNADRAEMLLRAVEGGLMPTVMTDPEQYARFLEVLGIDGFETEQSLDYKRARTENQMLLRAEGWQTVMREPGDNDLIHLAIHTRDRKRSEFQRLPEEAKQRWLMHEMTHIEAVIESGGLPDVSEFATRPDSIEGGEGGMPGEETEQETTGIESSDQNGQEESGPPNPGGEQ